jgi:hypothetical protein
MKVHYYELLLITFIITDLRVFFTFEVSTYLIPLSSMIPSKFDFVETTFFDSPSSNSLESIFTSRITIAFSSAIFFISINNLNIL